MENSLFVWKKKKMASEDLYPFKCKDCPEKFQLMKDVMEHFLNAHGESNQKVDEKGQKSFKCHFCELTFSKRVEVKSHEKTVHEGQKRYQCVTCGAGFASKQTLLNHVTFAHDSLSKENSKGKCISNR